jgi:hypothetical protein
MRVTHPIILENLLKKPIDLGRIVLGKSGSRLPGRRSCAPPIRQPPCEELEDVLEGLARGRIDLRNDLAGDEKLPGIARQSSWQARVIHDGKGSRGIGIMPLMIVAGKLSFPFLRSLTNV